MQKLRFRRVLCFAHSLLARGLFVVAMMGGALAQGQEADRPGRGAEIRESAAGGWFLHGGTHLSGRGFQAQYDLRSGLPEARLGIGLTGSVWFVQRGLRVGYAPNALSVPDVWSDTVSGGWLTPLGDGSTVLGILGTGGVGHSLGQRDSGDRQFWGPRLHLAKNFNDKLDGHASAGATFSIYRGMTPQFLVSRHETLYDLTVGLTWTVAKGLSVRPQVSFTRHGNSSADFYLFDRADTSVSLRFDY